MKTLVVYFSLKGHTEKAATRVAERLRAHKERVVEVNPTNGLMHGAQALMRKKVDIKPTQLDAAQYDLVVLVTPIWAGQVCPPMLAYIDKNKAKFKKYAVLFTQMGKTGEYDKLQAALEAQIGSACARLLSLCNKDPEHDKLLAGFAEGLAGK